jgi:hypothetical protein
MEVEYIDETRLMITLNRCVTSVLLTPEELVKFTDFVIEQVSNPHELSLPDIEYLELPDVSVSVDCGSLELEVVVIYISSACMMAELILSPSEVLGMCKAITSDDGDPNKLQQYWCLPEYVNEKNYNATVARPIE